MTITETADFFDLMQDKYGSPYFTNTEKERFLNQAQLNIISDFLPKEGDENSIERNANVWEVFSPLFCSTTATMDSSGKVSKSTVESALTTALGFTVKLIRPLAITWTDTTGTRPIKGPTRQNNWSTYLNNFFKKPIVKEPRYYETNSTYVISPVDQAATITISAIRYPKAISISGSQGSELSEIGQDEVVARALELAGVASRDQMLSELKKSNKA